MRTHLELLGLAGKAGACVRNRQPITATDAPDMAAVPDLGCAAMAGQHPPLAERPT